MLKRYCRFIGATLALAASLATGSPAGAVTYTFDNALSATNDFSVTSGGQTAAFSSASGPATFTVNPSADIFTFPVALGGFGNLIGDPLTITFSDPVMDRILIPFGIFEAFAFDPVTLLATADDGEAAVFTTTSYNSISGSPEGQVDFTPAAPITALTLTSDKAFAIASVDLTDPAVDVAEPMSVALLAGGLLMLALMRRRRG